MRYTFSHRRRSFDANHIRYRGQPDPGARGLSFQFARGCPSSPESDYAPGVLVDVGADGLRTRTWIAHELSRALQTDKVDVVLLNRTRIELAHAINAQGEVLYEENLATRVEYEAYVLGRYGDCLPVLRSQREDILRGDAHVQQVHRYRAALGRTEPTLDQIPARERSLVRSVVGGLQAVEGEQCEDYVLAARHPLLT